MNLLNSLRSHAFYLFSPTRLINSIKHEHSCKILYEKHHDLAECNEIVCIAGNENVDQKAKYSLNLHPTNFLLPYSNFKPFINRYIVNKWQLLWNSSVGNKLFEIKPVIGQSQPVVRNVRQEEVVLARLRIGQTKITHTYLLKERSNRIVFDVMHPLQSTIFYLNVVISLT